MRNTIYLSAIFVTYLSIGLTENIIQKHFSESIQKLVYNNNWIYVGAEDRLYKLHVNLTIEDSVKVVEESQCSINKNIQVLEIFKNFLLVCTTQRCGLCSLYDFSLNLIKHLSDNVRDHWQKLASERSIQIVKEEREGE